MAQQSFLRSAQSTELHTPAQFKDLNSFPAMKKTFDCFLVHRMVQDTFAMILLKSQDCITSAHHENLQRLCGMLLLRGNPTLVNIIGF